MNSCLLLTTCIHTHAGKAATAEAATTVAAAMAASAATAALRQASPSQAASVAGFRTGAGAAARQ